MLAGSPLVMAARRAASRSWICRMARAPMPASLATLLIEQQDPVGLALFDSQERKLVGPAATQAQLVRIIGELESAQPDRETQLGPVLQTLAEKLKKRGLIVIISDLLTDLDSFYDGLSRLQYRGQEIMVLHVLDVDELELPFDDYVLFKDIEGEEQFFAEPWGFRKAYKAAMETFIGDVGQRCRAGGVDHVLLKTSDDLGVALSHYLHSRQRQAGTKHLGRIVSFDSPAGE